MIPRSLPGWSFSSATAAAASPRSRTEFSQASAFSRVLETTYLVVAFMRSVNGFPSVRRAQAVMKSCQVRRPNSMSPGPDMPLAISRPITSSWYRSPQPPWVKPPRVSSSARPRPCTTPSRVTHIVTVIERMNLLPFPVPVSHAGRGLFTPIRTPGGDIDISRGGPGPVSRRAGRRGPGSAPWPRRAGRGVRSLSVDTDPPPAALMARARELWEYLAGGAARFAPAMSVAVSRGSGLGPAGWAGLVVLDGAVLATAPDHDTARVIEQALGGLPAASLGDTGVLASRLPAAEVIGPAALAYLDPAGVRPQPGLAVAVPTDLDDPGFRQFLLAASPDDAGESGIGEIATRVFAIREG